MSWLNLTMERKVENERCAIAESERSNSALERSHSSSASALIQILEAYA